MAGIDKIYGDRGQWCELYNWLKENNCDQIDGWNEYMYNVPPIWAQPSPDGLWPLCNFPGRIDRWLLAHCPLDWVQTLLNEQHNVN